MENIILTILSSMGGTTVILGGLFGWLGKRYLDKSLEAEKNRNRTEMASLQNSISKDIESHKANLKYDAKFFEGLFEASDELYSIREKILPEKAHPFMEWDEACIEIAKKFPEIEGWLKTFVLKNYTILPPDILESLRRAEIFCNDGQFSEPEINQEKLADKVFENVNSCCIELKSLVDEKRSTNLEPLFVNMPPNKGLEQTHEEEGGTQK